MKLKRCQFSVAQVLLIMLGSALVAWVLALFPQTMRYFSFGTTPDRTFLKSVQEADEMLKDRKPIEDVFIGYPGNEADLRTRAEGDSGNQRCQEIKGVRNRKVV